MTRVDFYLLRQHIADGRLRFACRLAHKLYRLGSSAFIHVRDEDEAKKLDEMLWVFDQGSFIPHHRHPGADPALDSPIVIGWELPGNPAQNVLISLKDQTVDQFARFLRVADVVDDLDDERAVARQRYRACRARGFDLETHDVQP